MKSSFIFYGISYLRHTLSDTFLLIYLWILKKVFIVAGVFFIPFYVYAPTNHNIICIHTLYAINGLEAIIQEHQGPSCGFDMMH